MSVTLTTIISAPVASYASLQDFRDAIGAIYEVTDVQTKVSTGISSGDIEVAPVTTAEIVADNYEQTIVTVFKDQATADAYLADGTVADEIASLDATFTVDRVFT